MKTIFFFDDWMLEQKVGLERIIGQPNCLGELFPKRPAAIKRLLLSKPFFNPQLKCYVMYLGTIPEGAGENNIFTMRLESDRPDHWELPAINEDASPLWTGCPNVVMDGETGRPIAGSVTPLMGTPHADRGYLMTCGHPQMEGRRHFLAFSQDGINFKVDREHPWILDASDTWNGVVYDDRSQTYRIFCRPGGGDRREAVVITSDLETFTKPMVIFQPDGNDPVLTEIYGLPNLHYEDMFVGFPQIYTPSPFEPRRIKMEGRVVPELAYSYNGLTWYRTNRRPFLPLRPLGEVGGGGLYLDGLVRESDGRVLLYARATMGDHASDVVLERAGKDKSANFGALLYELRQDGFCYLATSGREGRLRTRTIIPRAGGLSLNVRTAPHSQVRVQIFESGTRDSILDPAPAIGSIVPQTPVPGYTFEDCIPIAGNHLNVQVHWQEHADLSQFIGRPIRIEIQAIEAELYAIRLDCLGYWSKAETEHLG